MKLQLFGTAIHCVGFDESLDRSVVRLRGLDNSPSQTASDFVLVRSLEDFECAKSRNWQSFFVIGEEHARFVSETNERVIVVSPQFDYVGNGDIVGVRHPSGRFRVLYRTQSKHNSFLVTERCNNYCLMCSQPPKDINDQWILDEIKESLPLVDPGTRSLTFTGGEPLTD
jgi:hypothetical protein